MSKNVCFMFAKTCWNCELIMLHFKYKNEECGHVTIRN